MPAMTPEQMIANLRAAVAELDSPQARQQIAMAADVVDELECCGDVGEVSYVMLLDALAVAGFRLAPMSKRNVASEAFLLTAALAGLP